MPDITLNSLQFPGLSDTYKIPPQANEFSSTETYAEGTYVTYQGQLYKCTTAITTAGSWTGSTNWTQINIGDAVENLTTDLSTKLNISAISTTAPNMDGTAAAGSTGDVSDAGHIHPTDTSRAPAGFGLGVALNTLTAITDANDISETGWFCTVSTTSNLPSDRDTSYAGAIESVVRGTTYMCQRYYDYHAAKIYERIKNESGWGSWKLTSPTATEQELAYVERGSTASRAYAAGEYFCMNGQLYRATSTIASGVSFATGSSGNCTSVKAMDYYSNTWTPSNVTVATGNAPRNRYIRSGGFLVIYFAAALTTDLADVSTLEICSDVAATFGVTDILTPFVKAAAISTRTSAATGDIIFNLQYNSNKLTLMNRSGVTVPAANRNVFAWLMLGII